MKKLLLVGVLIFALSGIAQAQAICGQSAVINVSAGQTGTLVTAIPGQTFYVCGFVITSATAGATAIFNTNSTALTGSLVIPLNGNVVFGNGNGTIFQGAISGTITLTAATGTVSGVLSYRQ